MKRPRDAEARELILESLLQYRREMFPVARAKLTPERYREFRRRTLNQLWALRRLLIQVEDAFEREAIAGIETYLRTGQFPRPN